MFWSGNEYKYMGKFCPLRSLSLWVWVFAAAVGPEQSILTRKTNAAQLGEMQLGEKMQINGINTGRDF